MNIPWRKVFCGMLPLLALFSSEIAHAQTAPTQGIRENSPNVHALVNARIVTSPGRAIKRGTVILRDGRIERVGTNVAVPADARVWDYDGLTVYPGLIESYSHLGLPKTAKSEGNRKSGNAKTKRTGPTHWNSRVHPEQAVAELFRPKPGDLKKLRSLGFAAALIVPESGIFRGSVALVSLVDGKPGKQIIRDKVAQHLAFERGGWSDPSYPNSLMGAIALIRQTLLDADWYRRARAAYALNPTGQARPELDASLAALADAAAGRQAVIMKVSSAMNFLRATKIAREFGLRMVVRGSGDEYKQLEAVKRAGMPVILPVNFPKAPEVEDPDEALGVSLAELAHWEAAPENPRRLHEAGVRFTLTTAELKKPESFPAKVREAIKRGLPKDVALAALTTVPAELAGAQDQLGSIAPGKLGHLVVTNGDLFDKKTKVLDVWVDGRRYQVQARPEADPRGTWWLTLGAPGQPSQELELEIKGELKSLSATIIRDSAKTKVRKINLDGNRVTLVFTGDSLGHAGAIRLTGHAEKDRLSGRGALPDGGWIKWRAANRKPLKEKKEKKEDEAAPGKAKAASSLRFAYGAFTRTHVPDQPKNVLVRNATIWTCGPDGRLEDADLLITAGKIARIGAGLKAPSDAVVIDAQGKHVTPGLIDAHSHSGVSGGVNEGTQAVTAEVRIGDVIDSYSIAFYRELAGGLTVANLLHGSANPIGGQSAPVKLRWGAPPDAVKIADATPAIKFALGENVKQSNWGERFTTRYPQTRMGVEQIIRDRFKTALDYERQWKEFDALKRKQKKGRIPPRRDLEMDTLLEILHGKRSVHCHSYRQDEILMLVRVAEDFGFTIGAFQHVLEGYKVAEALARHGAGASTFSDWWAYKFEVYDAIPYNGALMHDAGVVVSFNSDSGELARRMNTEAAKAVKYGGVSETEALKFVTLNPARQLGIDHRVGSLEAGKDGDFVIWNGSPLSTYSRCEQTWIEGRKYFDREEDLKLRDAVRTERARLIQKVLSRKNKNKGKPDGKSKQG